MSVSGEEGEELLVPLNDNAREWLQVFRASVARDLDYPNWRPFLLVLSYNPTNKHFYAFCPQARLREMPEIDALIKIVRLQFLGMYLETFFDHTSLDVRAKIDADEDYPKHEWVDIDPSDEKVRDVRESSTDIKKRMTGDYRYRVLEWINRPVNDFVKSTEAIALSMYSMAFIINSSGHTSIYYSQSVRFNPRALINI